MERVIEQPAVIYCRVSSKKQVTEGHGLESQETRCREYAKHKGYDIIQVFHDEGISGSLINRPGMHELLAFLSKNKKMEPIVLIDDVSRLARGLEAHIQLRMEISEAGGHLESPSIEFGDDSDSRLVENLLASVSQHQRQKNAEQVSNRMRARALNGYWVNPAPWGYRYDKVAGHGKLLVRDEPIAQIIQDALEGFASGRLESQVAVQDFLESHAAFPRGKNGGVHLQRVKAMLRRVLYSGYLTMPNWDIHLLPGQHEALISYDTFQKIQERLSAKEKATPRTSKLDEFPLRGFVLCGGCKKPLTSCWTKGRNHTYPYYLCHRKGCSEYGKSIRRDEIQTSFETLLRDLTPSKATLQMFTLMGEEWWKQHKSRRGTDKKSQRDQIKAIDADINKLLKRILESTNERIISTYESKIEELEEEKTRLAETVSMAKVSTGDFEDSFRTALSFLESPYKLWASEEVETKRLALNLAFSQKLPYHRTEGFRTPSISLPLRLCGDLNRGKSLLVGLEGLEPSTCRL